MWKRLSFDNCLESFRRLTQVKPPCQTDAGTELVTALVANHLLSSKHTNTPIASRPISMLHVKHTVKFLQDSSLEAINVLWIKKKRNKLFFCCCSQLGFWLRTGGWFKMKHGSHCPSCWWSRGWQTLAGPHRTPMLTLGCEEQRVFFTSALTKVTTSGRATWRSEKLVTSYPRDTVKQSLDHLTSHLLIC